MMGISLTALLRLCTIAQHSDISLLDGETSKTLSDFTTVLRRESEISPEI